MENYNNQGIREFYELESYGEFSVLCDGYGFIVDPEKMLSIAHRLVKTVDRFGDDIIKYNHKLKKTRLKKQKHTKIDKRSRIYLLESGGLYKVGISKNVERRVKELDNRPFKVKIVCYSDLMKNAQRIEKKLHREFAAHNVYGEWFEFNEDELETVKKKIVSGGKYGKQL